MLNIQIWYRLPNDAMCGLTPASCAPEEVPPVLVEQMAEGGRMMLPVGGWSQRLVILRKRNGQVLIENDIAVRLVPMIREK